MQFRGSVHAQHGTITAQGIGRRSVCYRSVLPLQLP
jgi:hypothetical protein